MPDFQHRDCTLVYDDHPGPAERAPVLLLHGLGSSARDWEYQLPALLGRYRLLVPDLRGHGRSGKPRGRGSDQTQAAKFFATKSQLTRFQNASTYFGRRLR